MNNEKKLNVKSNAVIKTMKSLTGDECRIASDAYGLGEAVDGQSGGCRAAFAAGMKYAAMKVGYPSQDKPWLRYFSR